MRYKSNPKHSDPWQRSRRGARCSRQTTTRPIAKPCAVRLLPTEPHRLPDGAEDALPLRWLQYPACATALKASRQALRRRRGLAVADGSGWPHGVGGAGRCAASVQSLDAPRRARMFGRVQAGRLRKIAATGLDKRGALAEPG